MTIEQILEILENYKLRIPPTVFYELKADIVNFEEPTTKDEHHRQNIQAYAHDFGVSEEQAEKELRVTPQEPRKGHWIKTGDYYTGAYGGIEYVECSCCREDSLEEGDFCPNCGADMRGEEE